MKLDFKTKANLNDEFLESLEKIPKGENLDLDKFDNKNYPNSTREKNKKKENFLLDNKDVKDLDKQ